MVAAGEQLAGHGRSPGERKCWRAAGEKISDALLEPSAPLIRARQRQGERIKLVRRISYKC